MAVSVICAFGTLGCPFSGRCTEPLAWSLGGTPFMNQNNSPLFATIPKEIRDMIFVYALTDCTPSRPHQPIPWTMRASLPPASSTKVAGQAVRYRSDIAFPLLWTCRAIYIETYSLPLSLNPIYYGYAMQMGKPPALLPWQFASIKGVDIAVQQVRLEQGMLYSHLRWDKQLSLQDRHNGVFVVPSLSVNNEPIYSHHFTLVHTDKSVKTKRLTDVLRDATIEEWSYSKSEFPFPSSSSARVSLAQPFTHITIRIGATDWWKWSTNPDSTDELQHLALDPSLSGESDAPHYRATAGRMKERAQERRNGNFMGDTSIDRFPPRYGSVRWGRIVDEMPDLRSLELVLETFAPKKAQLNAVVECAKTWTFPSLGSCRVFVWDGRVEESRWSRTVSPPHSDESLEWYDTCEDFEVRAIRFVKRILTG
ncbi:hypothetical protein IQ07DRAFT_668268 [Pyrenochaeta sp. DS3sAY3a]|nr:hypothetical protein IQ07DRAFT_668268 [Pyrenochaeta sp. DS3sAY3a]